MPRRQGHGHRNLPPEDPNPFFIAATTPGHPLEQICREQRIPPEEIEDILRNEMERCQAEGRYSPYEDVVWQVQDEYDEGMYDGVGQGGGRAGGGRHGGHGAHGHGGHGHGRHGGGGHGGGGHGGGGRLPNFDDDYNDDIDGFDMIGDFDDEADDYEKAARERPGGMGGGMGGGRF